MRRKSFLIITLIMTFLFTLASAETLDFSNMTDEELQTIISIALDELDSRHATESSPDGELHMAEGTILLDQNGIAVTLTDQIDTYGSSDNVYMELEVIVENNSSETIYVNVDGSSINGWEVFGAGIADIGVSKKKKGTFTFSLSDADISDPSEIEELEVSFSVSNAESWNTIFNVDPVVLVP